MRGRVGVHQVSERQAAELLVVARSMRAAGARLLVEDAGDRVGSGMLKWADRCELVAGRAARRLRLVDGDESMEEAAG